MLNDDVLFHIFRYLNNYCELSLVSNEWYLLTLKSRHDKIIQRLNEIHIKISARSNLINVVKKLVTLCYHSENVQKLIDIHNLTKLATKTWWEIDRASQYINDDVISSELFPIFDEYDCFTTDDDNIIVRFSLHWDELKDSLKKLIYFGPSYNFYAYYHIIHQENLERLQTINKILKLFRNAFYCEKPPQLGRMYDRLLTLDVETIKESCEKLYQMCRNKKPPFYQKSIIYVIGLIPKTNQKISKDIIDSWLLREKSDVNLSLMEIISSVFDHELIFHRIDKLKQNNLFIRFFDHEFKHFINCFSNMMMLSDPSFELLINFKDINWGYFFWELPSEMVDIPYKKLARRFEIINDSQKKAKSLPFFVTSLLHLNKSCLKSFCEKKISKGKTFILHRFN